MYLKEKENYLIRTLYPLNEIILQKKKNSSY